MGLWLRLVRSLELGLRVREYELEGARPRGKPKKTGREIVEKDCQACRLNMEMPWIVIDG